MKKSIISLVAACMAGVLIMSGCGAKEQVSQSNSAEKKEFHYAMSGLFKPFNYKESNELKGFDVEIGKALAKKMGMKAVPVTNPWETIIQGLQAKKYDAILGSMTITDERKKVVDFSNPYYRSGSQVFVSENNTDIKSPDDLKGKRIGVAKGTPYKDLALKYTSKENIVEYDTDLVALMDLPSKRIDAAITDRMVGLPIIKSGTVKIKDVGKPMTHDDQAIAVRKEDKELMDKLNKAMDEIIKDGTYDKISDKYFGRNILGTNN
ncbi:ABC transporter substrate-binding protein [Neobacillus sp. BF23-41]|uniref:ABC transporter substrate-binding protein n=1 Tax=Neobacillus sp. BF23-41 TaxID=3240280 RepID=UPI0034E40477